MVVQKRLSSSKNIIVVDQINNNTYDEAKIVCKDICGDLYFPSSQKENDEVESVLDGHERRWDIGYVWIRIYYDQSDGKWKDPENKENLTFTNVVTYGKQNAGDNHAILNLSGYWDYRDGSYLGEHLGPGFYISTLCVPFVLCEQTLIFAWLSRLN